MIVNGAVSNPSDPQEENDAFMKELNAGVINDENEKDDKGEEEKECHEKIIFHQFQSSIFFTHHPWSNIIFVPPREISALPQQGQILPIFQ